MGGVLNYLSNRCGGSSSEDTLGNGNNRPTKPSSPSRPPAYQQPPPSNNDTIQNQKIAAEKARLQKQRENERLANGEPIPISGN